MGDKAMKNKQMDIVFDIVKAAKRDGLRTEQVKMFAMYKGVSCADRYLRWLRERGMVKFWKKENDKTKTWYSSAPEADYAPPRLLSDGSMLVI